MSHYQMQRGLNVNVPMPPPPPVIHNRNSPNRDRFRGRSRSRSPNRRGDLRNSFERRSRISDERDRMRERRRRSPSPRLANVKEEGKSSSHLMTSYGGGGSGYEESHMRQHGSQMPMINRIPTEASGGGTGIIRHILNPETVKIPRRVNEGLRPIFDREELKEAMIRRIKSCDNENNPHNIEQQRVVAIIREPVPMAPINPQFIQAPEIIPILPPAYHQMVQMTQSEPNRFETSSGVTYSYTKRSRSRSMERDNRRSRIRHASAERRKMISPSGGRRRFRSRSRSRSASPSRVRHVREFPLNSTSVGRNVNSQGELDRNREFHGDLRESLNNRHQLAKAHAEGYRGFGRGGFRGSMRGGFAKSSVPKRGPWKHDKFRNEEAEAKEEGQPISASARAKAARAASVKDDRKH